MRTPGGMHGAKDNASLHGDRRRDFLNVFYVDAPFASTGCAASGVAGGGGEATTAIADWQMSSLAVGTLLCLLACLLLR